MKIPRSQKIQRLKDFTGSTVKSLSFLNVIKIEPMYS